MSDSHPALEFREEQPCVFIPISVPLSEWGKTIPLVPEIAQWLGKRGVEPAGAPFYRYLTIGDMQKDAFDLEIGWPVVEAMEGDERVRAGVIPGGVYATSIHTGHPDSLVGTCAGLLAWGEQEGVQFDVQTADGREVWAGRFEFYLSDPADVPDMNDWQTDVAFLTKGS
ncbi:MAG TPA: GyrI-like domain-containing protein [Thermomicrobiales bacterium]|nr:GyrI-like domain-containing protein [Thermomicrobiales bacterium]